MESKKDVLISPEPWQVSGSDGIMLDAHGYGVPMTVDIMRRIVACVNACKGIGTETLERYNEEHKPENGFGLHREAELISQRDELLAALKRISAWNEHTVKFAVDNGSNGVRDLYRSIADEAIAKCEVKS